jgi:hypothetical protein
LFRAFDEFAFGGGQAVKVIDQRVNLAVERGAFVFVKIRVAVSARPSMDSAFLMDVRTSRTCS